MCQKAKAQINSRKGYIKLGLSVSLSSLLGIGYLGFSNFCHGVRNTCKVKGDGASFLKNEFFASKMGKIGQRFME